MMALYLGSIEMYAPQDKTADLAPAIRIIVPEHSVSKEQKALRNRRIIFLVLLLGGLALAGYPYDALDVLGIWACLAISAGSIWVLWVGMRKGQKIYREIYFDFEGIRRIDLEHFNLKCSRTT